ncbi:hypothetical protein FVE85_7041 [Porphyridium purpureum]|uniref:CBM20 domain-containing protein n=1 Tax=Porphyridium purpureum TaxID=35688 RepID=A0A5J4Z6V7_PORPP|nr:hypothetical protein FVE85_7041 [Porphyridium purpureum]|eukprot:POR1212..scf295_1
MVEYKVRLMIEQTLASEDVVRVVGNLACLGAWNVLAAPVMRKGKAGSLLLEFVVPSDQLEHCDMEYKYVLSNASARKAHVKWENGNNRVISREEFRATFERAGAIEMHDAAFRSGASDWCPCDVNDEPFLQTEAAESEAPGKENAAPVAKESKLGDLQREAQPQIVRVFSLPFFNPMTEQERRELSRQRAQEQEQMGLHIFGGFGRLFSKPVVKTT